jgi:hypothetical protein
MVADFLAVGSSESDHSASLGIQASKNMPNDSVFARGIHPLQDHQERSLAACKEAFLCLLKLGQVLLQGVEPLVLAIELIASLRCDFGQSQRIAFLDSEFFVIKSMGVHGYDSWVV